MQERYISAVAPALMEQFGYKNIHAVPRIVKIVVNTGFGRLTAGKSGEDQRKIADGISKDLAMICGQRPALTRARKSIAGFKLREGALNGAKVTLRGKRMHDFLGRLVHVVLPRSRDFQGILLSAVDKNGNLTVGIREHSFFPEAAPEKLASNVSFGLEVGIVTSASSREEGIALLRGMGIPFREKK